MSYISAITQVLRLDRNRFVSAASLGRFSTLTYLDLSDNRLTSLKGLQNLVCLEELLVDRNELTDDGDLQVTQTLLAGSNFTHT